MEIVGFALALVAFLSMIGIWVWSSKQARTAAQERRQLEEQLARAEEHGKQIEARVEEVSEQSKVLEKELAEAVARRDEKAMATAMWALELERSYRQWRDVIVPSSASQGDGLINAGQQLAFAVGQEVERLREEVGVSIRFDGGFDVELEPDVALAALRVSEELLAMAAKRADEVDVSLDQPDNVVEISVTCRGWEEGHDPIVSDLATSVQQMAERLDGSVAWDRTSPDDLTVEIRFPIADAVDETVDVDGTNDGVLTPVPE